VNKIKIKTKSKEEEVSKEKNDNLKETTVLKGKSSSKGNNTFVNYSSEDEPIESEIQKKVKPNP